MVQSFNYDSLLGIKYKKNGRTIEGLNCLGLVNLIHILQDKEFPIDQLPSEEELIYKLVIEEQKLFQKIEIPEKDCIVLFKFIPKKFHVGCIMEDTSKFIHIIENRNVTIDSLESPIWKRLLIGYYKWIK